MLRNSIHTGQDFLLPGKGVPVWITVPAFLAAGLGGLETAGMAALGAKYGMLACHYYWIASVPAMIFLGVFMMPFYFGTRARSVPDYLRLRFDSKTRSLYAGAFAVMAVLMGGLNLYAAAAVLQTLLGWPIHIAIFLGAGAVLAYIYLGGLRAAIYNNAAQFVLIVAGLAPLTLLGLRRVGGWQSLSARLDAGHMSLWSVLDDPAHNQLGVPWLAVVLGLGFVLSFGYWCTDFLLVQRAMAARSVAAAQMTPILAAFPRAILPFVIVVPGMIATALLPDLAGNYNEALPRLMRQLYPAGLMGLGVTALFASLMSGMTACVSALNTVVAYDLYITRIRRIDDEGQEQQINSLDLGRIATVSGVVLSVGAAYLVVLFNNVVEYMVFLFSVFTAPLFATFLLAMFWKRANGSGAFWGLVSGVSVAGFHYSLIVGGIAEYPSDTTGYLFSAIYAFTACFVVTVAASWSGAPYPERNLVGLVYTLTPRPQSSRFVWYRRPVTWGIAALALTLWLNYQFW